MKIAMTALAVAITLGAARAGAGPGFLDPASTNACDITIFGTLPEFDADGDGTITSNEFATVSATLVQELQTRFLAKYDSDQDGTVTSAEALAVNQAIAEQWLTNLSRAL